MGIVGSTVMPHNLYLHSNIVKNRSNRSIKSWGEIRFPTDQSTENLQPNSTDILSTDSNIQPQILQSDQNINCIPIESTRFWNKETMKHMIELTSLDSTIALSFALFINSAILIVSAAAFYSPGEGVMPVSDLPEAYRLLVKNIGQFAG